MPIVTTIDVKKKIIIHVARGKIPFSEIKETMDALLQNPDYDPSFNSLWDFYEAVTEKFHIWQIKELAQYIKEFAAKKKTRRKIAYVTKNPYHYGLIRMFLVFVENEFIDTGIYQERNEALDWLNK
jgi:hypothetical protein